MSQNVYILVSPENETIANKLSNDIFVNKIFRESSLSHELLIRMATICLVEYFYVVVPNSKVDIHNFDFSFKPEEWDKHLIHIWNNSSSIKLFSKKYVLENPELYTDKAMLDGTAPIKHIIDKSRTHPIYDIVFMSYDEINADANFKSLSKRFGRTKHSSGVKGISQAHIAAAKLVTTELFYVVDADAEIVPTFNFEYVPEFYSLNCSTVWHSKNPVNGLEYGYGGVKLFPTERVLNFTGLAVDFTTSVTKDFNVIQEISNITRFDTDPFSAWRSGFRECVKLSSSVIRNQNNTETQARLDTWCNVGDGEFGNFVIAGARCGKKFGKDNSELPDNLKLINDFDWLKWKFNLAE